MESKVETTVLLDSGKKTYEAPELVVLGDAAEMTQAGVGVASDGIFSNPS